MENKLRVQEIFISVSKIGQEDCISLTDVAKYKNSDRPEIEVQNWIKNKKTLEFLLAWEDINNPDFKHSQMTVFIESPNYRLSIKELIEKTHAIGIISNEAIAGIEN